MFTINRLLSCILVFLTCFFLSACRAPWSSDNSSDSSARNSANAPFTDFKILFDWNVQTDEFICSGINANNNLVSVGVDFSPSDIEKNTIEIDILESYIQTNLSDSIAIAGREDRLGILNIEILDCEALNAVRSLPSVQFVEAKYVAPITKAEVFDQAVVMQSQSRLLKDTQEKSEDLMSPGSYNPNTAEITYVEHIRKIDEVAADRIEQHQVNKIYEEFGFYGTPNLGVAIMDNGIFEHQVDYLSQGQGLFEAEGYVRPFGGSDTDGPYPRPYDLFGLMPSMADMYGHGTTQTKLVYSMAPNINIKSVRGADFVFWFMPGQFQGVVDAILALAEDPTVRIVSSSMGTVIHVHEIERAIAYFNARDKLYISAGGTSSSGLRDLAKVVFPASLSSTISTTGIKNTKDTDGEFILGDLAHGGAETDFVIDHSRDSSQSVSSMAGMIGLLWSYHPSLSREQMIDILIRASSNYQSLGRKDAYLGWGKVDMYKAFLAVKKLKDG